MALARLAMKNLQQKVLLSGGGSLQKQYKWWSNNNEKLVARFSSGVGDKVKSEGSEVAVSEGNNNSKKSRLLPKRRGRRWLSRNLDRDFPPTPFGIFFLLRQFVKNSILIFNST